MDYPNIDLFIAGRWRPSVSGDVTPVEDPATGRVIGSVASCSRADLDEALVAAEAGFQTWRAMSVFDRYKIMRKAAELLRNRQEHVAQLMTREEGKPLSESRAETAAAADILDWFAEEGRRAYGRVIPARAPNVYQLSMREPVGPVAAFTPWNFPLNQIIRKMGPALAAGCSIIVKGPEETPASPAELFRCFAEPGVPLGVVNLIFGKPADVSSYLIPHPVIRKVSFTGSVPVGKQLASLAGLHMKRTTMELGGHAPAVVFDDADLEAASKALAFAKFRNAGQVCIAPTRFLVQESVFEEFKERLTAAAKSLKVGNGLEDGVQMGPLIHTKRLGAVEELVADAVARGARIETGGRRIGNEGNFYEPTVLSSLDTSMRAMNEEPFGPIALMLPFREPKDALAEANRLPYGLAAYAWTRSTTLATMMGNGIQSGMVTINHLGLALPETPYGGIKDSGYGSEGGSEAIEPYMTVKFVSQAGI